MKLQLSHSDIVNAEAWFMFFILVIMTSHLHDGVHEYEIDFNKKN